MADLVAATLQWHDRFDQSFGVTAADCSELLDWPGKTAPFSEKPIEKYIARMRRGRRPTIDWDQMNRFRGQVKFETYKGELIRSNPELAEFEQTKIVFLMRSAGEARAMRELDGGVIVV